jgi:hypothetical protein
VHLTEEEIAADVVLASAMEEGSDELEKPQRSTIQNKLLRPARDGNDAVINYMGLSINPKLHAHYEHVRTVRGIIYNRSTGLFRHKAAS